jgi:hypothetical protein
MYSLPRACLLAFATATLISTAAAAQVPPPAKLLVTVADPSGGVIPGATVTIVGEDAATKSAAPPPVKASDKGLATFESVPLGRYTILAEFTGFEPGGAKGRRAQKRRQPARRHPRDQSSSNPVEVSQDRPALAGESAHRVRSTLTTRDQRSIRRPAKIIAADRYGGRQHALCVDSFLGGPRHPKALIS